MADLREKLAILADAAKYDASCASSGAKRGNGGMGLGDTDGVGICHSYTPDGRCVSLLKILLTNYCVYDCKYCVNRITSDVPRARFAIEEVVWLTMEFYRRNYIEGLFLSSGIIQSPDYTMEQLVEVARRLREGERFFGYIHLKAVPGASEGLLRQAGRVADRLSANVELPRDEDLRALAPEKTLTQVEMTMSVIREGVREYQAEKKKSVATPRFAPAGQSTQLIVGATDASDATILHRADAMYSRQRLRRVYYSAYSPIQAADTRLPSITPPLMREHRLYQADWLMRFYGFTPGEITEGGNGDVSNRAAKVPTSENAIGAAGVGRPLDGTVRGSSPDLIVPTAADVSSPTDSIDVGGNLALDIDPKLAWALRHREFFPVDVNRAGREAILRVPGIGVRNTKRILAARRHAALRLIDLKRLRVALGRAKPFIVAADHSPDTLLLDSPRLKAHITGGTKSRGVNDTQMLLFAKESARTGEL